MASYLKSHEPKSYNKDEVLAAMTGRWSDFYGRFTALRPNGGELRGPCPLHGGDGPNFTVQPQTGHWFCHSQCQEGGDAFDFLSRREGMEFPDALAAVAEWAGTPARQHPSPDGKGSRQNVPRTIAQTYDYTDEAGDLLFQAVRYEPKGFAQRRPAANGATNGTWIYSLGDTRRVLYRLPEVLAHGTQPVWVVEGEKDADALCALGAIATCNPMGAGKWQEEYSQSLIGATVLLLPDNDEAGRVHAQIVAASVHKAARRVRIVSPPGLPPKGDVSDFLAAGGTLEELERLAKAAPDWTPDQALPEPASAATPQPREAGWEPPVPFTDASLPPFPVNALPVALAGFVAEVTASVQVPADVPGLLALGVVGAASARTCRVQVGQTHVEPLNLYLAAVMEPGSRKSGVMEAMTQPLREAERDLAAQMAPVIEQAQEILKMQEKRVAYLQDVATKGKPDAAAGARSELSEIQASPADPVPAMPRLLADDVTPEKLAELMAEQAGTLAITSAEGGIFGILAGRYSDGKANLDLFLKGHAGEEVRVDRKGSAGVFIASACLSLLLAVQPDVLSSLAETPSFRGRGLVGRFLYSLPENQVGTRLYQNRPIDAHARASYAQAIRAILDLPVIATPEAPGRRHELRLEGAALSVWAGQADAVERRQAPGGDLADIRDWASKLAGAVARIAAGFHLVEHAAEGCPWTLPIAVETIERAWAVGEYLIHHALAAYGLMGASPNTALARRLLRWVERTQRVEFSLRDCHQAHRSLSQVDLTAALTLLCERGFLRQLEEPKRIGAGRTKTPIYQLNPYTQNTQNTQN